VYRLRLASITWRWPSVAICCDKTRSGTFAPRFAVEDFVYLKRQKADSLDPRVGHLILRVKSVGSGGRLVLKGRDKKRDRDHVENGAPCHLPNLDTKFGKTRG
jgi:hypothetical protein